MGQQVNPISFRMAINKAWSSRWFATRADYSALLLQDLELRKYILKKTMHAGIHRIIIERSINKIDLLIYAARPPLIIGKGGAEIEALKNSIQRMLKINVTLNVIEIRNPKTSAVLIAREIAQNIEKRVDYRKSARRAIQGAMPHVKGIKVICSGRLNGAEIARTEKQAEGPMPLQTLRKSIDYGTAVAHTTYGTCGVKVWVCSNETQSEVPSIGMIGNKRPSWR